MTDVLNLINVVSVALELNNQAANERTIALWALISLLTWLVGLCSLF